MDSVKKVLRMLLIAVICVSAFLVGEYYGGRKAIKGLRPITVRDTLWKTKLVPSSTIIIDKVPTLLFFTDTNYVDSEPVIIRDSIPIDVTVVRREYKDSTYYASISGPAIGGLFPSLDSLAMYRKTTYIPYPVEQERKPWALGPEFSATVVNGAPFALTGLGVTYQKGRYTLETTAGYELFGRTPSILIRAKWDLIRF